MASPDPSSRDPNRPPLPKDDVSSAPESGDKPDAAPQGTNEPAGRSGTAPGGRPGPARAKDDVSRAPESGDKPDAAGG